MRIAARAKPRTLKRSHTPAAAVVVALTLGGCAQVQRGVNLIQPPPVNPSSPIAAYADQVSHETFPTPNFRQVPPKPTDVRSAADYKTAVISEVAMRRALAEWRIAHPDLQSDTEAWADLQRHRISEAAAARVPEAHDAEAEAFAKRLREEAAKSPPQ
jgi:hypothetical protein